MGQFMLDVTGMTAKFFPCKNDSLHAYIIARNIVMVLFLF